LILGVSSAKRWQAVLLVLQGIVATYKTRCSNGL